MKAVIAVALALSVLLALPAAASGASIGAKCQALVTELNRYREPNVRVRSILCTIAHNRSLQMARAGYGFHNIAYVQRKLAAAGVCYRNVGEVIAWTTRTPSASRFISMWRGSSVHWSILTASRYDRAGGSWRAGLYDSRTYSTMLVLDSC